MKPDVTSHAAPVFAFLAAGLWIGCSSSGVDPGAGAAGSGSVSTSSGRSTTSGSAAGGGSSSGSNGGTGVDTTAEAGPGVEDATASAVSGSTTPGDAAAGSGGASGSIAAEGGTQPVADAKAETGGSSSGGSAEAGPNNCNLPATVSFQKDVLPFLTTACGGGGCHVIDSASTMSMGGYDHGYDWITAGAHPSSCPTAPKRFEVTIAVINQANPPSCVNSRKMPPPGPGARAPLTPCQIATLQAWLDEPLVTQLHRPDTTSPTTPYPMPPFN